MSKPSARIWVPSMGWHVKTGGQFVWKALTDSWRSCNLPLFDEKQVTVPMWLRARPLWLAFWYGLKFRDLTNTLLVVDQSQSARLGILLRHLHRRPTTRLLVVVHHLRRRFRYGNRLYTRFARWNETRTLRMADRIVVHTNHEKDQIVSRGVPRDLITVIPIGIKPQTQVLPIRTLDKHEPMKVLWVGGDFVRKGMNTLLLALTRCRDIRPCVTVVGLPEDQDVYLDAQNYVRFLKLESSVHFLGMVDQDVLDRLWFEHDLYIQPSLQEGHGLALDEALIRGMPIIASDLSVFRERLGTSDVRFVPPGDATALALALDSLRQRDRRLHLSNTARSRASILPSWEETLVRYESLVRQELAFLQT